eukprot:UN27499
MGNCLLGSKTVSNATMKNCARMNTMDTVFPSRDELYQLIISQCSEFINNTDLCGIIFNFCHDKYIATDEVDLIGDENQIIEWVRNKDHTIDVQYLNENAVEQYEGIMYNEQVNEKITFRTVKNETLHFGFGFATYNAFQKIKKKFNNRVSTNSSDPEDIKSEITPINKKKVDWCDWTGDDMHILFDNYFSAFQKKHWKAGGGRIGDLNEVNIEITEDQMFWTFNGETKVIKRKTRKCNKKYYPVIVCSWCKHFSTTPVTESKPARILMDLH